MIDIEQPFTGPDFDAAGAVFSPCEQYRYLLWRRLAPAPAADAGREVVVAFVGLNPSTATAELDDPTIRRCIGFARAWGAGLFIMANAYGYRSTDPRGLRATGDPIGHDNDHALARVARWADLTVAAWGAHALPGRVHVIRRLFNAYGRGMHCLGVTKNGSPRHPLYMPKTSKPRPWR